MVDYLCCFESTFMFDRKQLITQMSIKPQYYVRFILIFTLIVTHLSFNLTAFTIHNFSLIIKCLFTWNF